MIMINDEKELQDTIKTRSEKKIDKNYASEYKCLYDVPPMPIETDEDSPLPKDYPPYSIQGMILKYLIRWNGLTQKQAAERLHIPEYKLSRYCLGKQEMSYDDLKLVSYYFEISTDLLLGKNCYFNELVMFETKMNDAIPFGLEVLEDIVSYKKVWDLKTKMYYFVDDVNFVNKELELSGTNKKFKFKDYKKTWTI